jgi:hypothetical protein
LQSGCKAIAKRLQGDCATSWLAMTRLTQPAAFYQPPTPIATASEEIYRSRQRMEISQESAIRNRQASPLSNFARTLTLMESAVFLSENRDLKTKLCSTE